MLITELKEYIYNNEKIEFILEELNCGKITYHENKEYYSACHCDGDNPMGIVISNNKYLNYISYSRNVNYEDNKDLISLIEDTKRISFKEAIIYLHNILGLEYVYTPYKKNNTSTYDTPSNFFKRYITPPRYNVAELEELDEEILNDYVPLLYKDWLVKDGITERARKKFELHYSYKKKRVILPIRHWLTNALVGINARTVIPNYSELGIHKYYISKTYQKGLNIYGLSQNYEEIQQKGYVVVLESERSVLKRYSRFDGTCVAIQGKHISDEQVSILKGLNVEVIISLDKDVPLEHIRGVCEKFYGTRVSYTYDPYDLLGEKDSIADMDMKLYDFFIKYRVKYGEDEHKEHIKWLNSK